jgi:murein L,D-transpeptidase YcbB/YkuD
VVNIPEYELRLLDGGRPELAMRVVVGKDVSATPVFSDEISQVVFGPTWSIPNDIVTHEIVPALRETHDYLAAHHIRVLDGPGPEAHEVDPARLDLSDSAAVAAYSFRQDPGVDNALGKVKFVCPNRFNVYLHDTPAGGLFDQRSRSFSHGCVRVEQPADLAVALLRDTGSWPRERVQAAMDTARTMAVSLSKPVPVHILYWTAWVDDQGTLQFRPDVYDLDPLTDAALQRQDRSVTRSTSRLAASPPEPRVTAR